MKVLIIGEDESNSYLLDCLYKDGAEVKILTRYSQGGDLPRFKTANEALDWEPDYVICDSRGYAPFLRKFRDLGCGVVGGGPITDSLETNPVTALQYLEGAGVPTIDYQAFDTPETAIDYVLGSSKPWRLITSPQESSGYIDGDSLALALQQKADNGTLPKTFVVHRDFPGIEGAGKGALVMWSQFHICGFVHEKGLMNPCFVMVISQGLTDGGIPTIEGVTLIPISYDNPLISLTLGKLAVPLGRMNYTGPVSLGCLVKPPDYTSSIHWDENDLLTVDSYWDEQICVNRLSFTPPPGFWAAFCEGLQLKLPFFLERLCSPARSGNPFDFWEGPVVSRKLTLPPYPFTEAPWITAEQKLALMSMVPPIELPDVGGVYWSGVVSDGDCLKPISPVLGYLAQKATHLYEAKNQLRTSFESLKIPYSQVSATLPECLEMDLLPIDIAKRQLEWEREVETVTSKNTTKVKVVT